MTAPEPAPAQPNDRIRTRIAQVLDAADTADVTIGYLTAYSDGDRVTVQNVDRGYTPTHARALGQALGFSLIRDTTMATDRGRHVYANLHRDFTVEIYVEVPR